MVIYLAENPEGIQELTLSWRRANGLTAPAHKGKLYLVPGDTLELSNMTMSAAEIAKLEWK